MAKPQTTSPSRGERIATLRAQQGMTQDVLARKSDVDPRTVQRAEQGKAVSLETLASLAAALRVTVPDLVQADDIAASNGAADGEANTVVLKPLTSGMALLNMVGSSFAGRVECQAEPTPANIENLGGVVETLELHMPDPWREHHEEVTFTLAQRVREAVTLSRRLSELETQGVSLYASTYTASAKVPRYDMDEGHKYTTTRQPFEPVTMCRLILAPSGFGRIVLQVTDQWRDPAPSKDIEDAPFGDDIPF